MKTLPKPGKYALLALALLTLVVWLAWPGKTQGPVLTATVTRQDVEQTVLASGVLQAIEQVDVGAQVSRQVTYLAVEAGQQVKQGDLLAEIDPLIAQNNLKTAEAELASRRAQLKIKQAQLKQNELAWRRQQQMFRQEASSRADLESAEAQLAVTRAELQSAQADIDNAIRCLKELEKAMPNHPEASRTLKNLEAAKSIDGRGKAAGDYRDMQIGRAHV